jgi:hypothetical protein
MLSSPEAKKALTTIKQSISQRVGAKARELAPNNHIRKAIHVSTSGADEENLTVKFTVDTPDAGAYEYGSGIHRTQGNPAKYIIRPKNKAVLAFDWQKIPQNAKLGGGDKILGRGSETDKRTGGKNILWAYVEHPGVAAANNGRGYMRLALAETRKDVREAIVTGARAAILAEARFRFGKLKK